MVGSAGVTLRTLLKEYPDVTVTVPPPTDRESCTVELKGPRRQVTGASAALNTSLQAVVTARSAAQAKTRRPASLLTLKHAHPPNNRHTHPPTHVFDNP